MASFKSSEGAGRDGPPQVPHINVDSQNVGQNDNDAITTPTTPTRSLNPHLEETRGRSLSGSTFNPSVRLDIPAHSKGDISSNASTIGYGVDRDEALRPDPGTEADFVVDKNPFAFSPGQLNKLQNPKSLPAFQALGGLSGIARGLRTDPSSGLSLNETALDGAVTFEDALYANPKSKPNVSSQAPTTNGGSDAFRERIRVFKQNVIPTKKATPLWKLMWMAYNDKILILLTAAAVISLALGLYETFGVEHPPGAPMPVDWVEGCAICIAILIVVLVGSVNDYQKERAFVKLNIKKEDREVKIIRSGKAMMLSVHDILVGDVLHLEGGDLIPADGVFISGHSVKCDESSATGESDQIKKTAANEVLRQLESSPTRTGDLDPFIISGSKVLEGVGTYLVTSVGVNSSYGKILMAMRHEPEPTPLQVKLDGLAGAIAKLGSTAAGLLFFVLLFRFCAGLAGNQATSAEKGSQFMDILIVAITVIVVAVPEGLPLAVTLALAFATTQLLKGNNLVRVLKSCETMGNATTVCSDKTGTLTQNKMMVVTGAFGESAFDDKNHNGDEVRSAAFAQNLDSEFRRLLVESIVLNSTAFEGEENGEVTFIGSKTETALLLFARSALGMSSVSEERSNGDIVQVMPFDSDRKCMGCVRRLPNGGYRFLVKGAAEILLGYCSSRSSVLGNGSDLDESQRRKLHGVIDGYAKQSLRTIALIQKDFPAWPPAGTQDPNDPASADLDQLLTRMNFLGVVGIQDPVRPGVPRAVARCQDAGVMVRMVTGDNAVTAEAIATECGIYTDGLIVDGPAFRNLSNEQMKAKLPKLQVLARSSPEDKRILVSKLREMDEIVAVTGDGTNDGPALRASDIGFSMGIAGTEVAKEASAIVLMDDNFASILTALMWGRAVNDAVRKFLQFQITVNITAVILTFVSAVSNPDMRSVLTAVQLLWINLIMDSLAALALATDPPTEETLDRKPTPRSAPLISVIMWKMIIGQAIFQLIVTFTLYFAGPDILGYEPRSPELNSMIFNTFVWMQIFNEFNNRRLDNKFNIFQGIHRNFFFIVINCIMVGAQVLIAFKGGKAFSIIPIDGKQWAICIVLAALCLPWAILVRLFPDVAFGRIAKFVGWPVVLVYRPCSRFVDRVRAKTRRKKGEEGRDDALSISDGADIADRSAADLEKGKV